MRTRERRTYSIFILIGILIIAGGERSLKGAWRSGTVRKSYLFPGFPFGGRTDPADVRKRLVHSVAQANDTVADLIVYGATPAGITAAIEAAKLGHTVVLLEPTQHVGGMMTNGLGSTDVYGTYPIGGIAAQFFQNINAIYNANPASADGYNFEPHVAESLFKSMLAEQSNITVKLGVSFGSVSMNGTRITNLVGSDGATYQGTEYIDASYTGDLMAAAGVSYTVGRESAAKYNEPGAGVDVLEPPLASSIDPYIVPGDSSSGLIAHVSPDVLGAPGSADAGVMAYNYRLCLSSDPANQIHFRAPANYDSSEFEILKRRSQSEAPPRQLSDLLGLSSLPNHKYGVNNANVLSTDEIGESFGYPNGTPSARQSIEAEQTRYQQALLYFIANDPSVPKNVQSQAQALGLCKDEFTDNGGWPNQIYVREARRMLGAYVATLADLQGKASISDSIGIGGYPSDSHMVNLVNHNGQIEEDGGAQIYGTGTYAIPYRILTPLASQVTNLLVPVEVSASHIAYDSLRVEVTYMIMGQAAGAAASIAISQGSTVQDIPYSALREQLLNDGQVIKVPLPSSLSLSTTNVDFGIQSFGSYTNPQTVTLTNTGAEPLYFSSIGLAGSYASSYLSSNDCTALDVGGSCTIRVRFYPQIGITPTMPAVPASLVIRDNALNSPQFVSLTGTPQANALLSSLSPSIATAGGAAFTLTVNGSGFTSSSTVYWGATPLATQPVDSTQVTAQVQASDIASAGSGPVTVQNPNPAGSTSNSLQFEVDSASSITQPKFTPATATVTSGAAATYAVALPTSATNVSVTCLNLPAGATCSYSASTGTVSVATATSTPAGTYQITVVFTETLTSAATAYVALPILLLPLFFIRKKLVVKQLWFLTILAAVLSIAVVGCGGSSTSSTSQTYQVRSSGSVGLTVQQASAELQGGTDPTLRFTIDSAAKHC